MRRAQTSRIARPEPHNNHRRRTLHVVTEPPPIAKRAFLLVLDGLRPEFVTEALMPNLSTLAARGVRFTDAHAVLPTVTRCNSATIATGRLPGRHGIPGNRFVSRALDGAALNAGDHRDLEKLRAYRDGRIVLAPTLADAIHGAGGRTAVLGTGTPGASLLQNPEVSAHGDVLIHPAISYGIDMAAMESRFGPLPAKAVPATGLNRYFTRLATEFVIPELRPELLVFWHTDPDHSQHAAGPGSPDALTGLRDADANLGALLESLNANGLAPETVVAVVSDHGFATNIGTVDIEAHLQTSSVLSDKRDQAQALGGLVYLERPDEEREGRIADALMAMPEVGGLFTRHALPGTFPLEIAGAAGPEAPDILYGLAWDDGVNENGIAGRAWSHPMRGAGNHGSFSPYEVRNTVVMAGPGLQAEAVSDIPMGATDIPMGATDIAPTLMTLLGRGQPNSCDGRVLHEALNGMQPPPHVERTVVSAETAGRRQTMPTSTVDGVTYIDSVAVERL